MSLLQKKVCSLEKDLKKGNFIILKKTKKKSLFISLERNSLLIWNFSIYFDLL
jgi:hypothetical protein